MRASVVSIKVAIDAAFCIRAARNFRRINNVPAATRSSNFSVTSAAAGRTPKASPRDGSPEPRMTSFHGPKRCRYSAEVINALTISASTKLPLN